MLTRLFHSPVRVVPVVHLIASFSFVLITASVFGQTLETDQASSLDSESVLTLTDEQQLVVQRVQRLRAKLDLQTADLAALETDAATAELLLMDMQAWVAASWDDLERAEAAEYVASLNLKAAYRDLHQASSQEEAQQAIRSRRSDHSKASATRDQYLQSLRTMVSLRLGGEKTTGWETIRENRTLPRSLQYVGPLTESQRSALKTDLRQRAQRLPADAEVKGRQAVGGLSSEALASRIESAEARIRTYTAGIKAAEQRVLGLPASSLSSRRIASPSRVSGR